METTQLALRREAQRARFRHAWWIALAAGATGNGLLVLAMWAAAPRPAPAAVNVMPAAATAAAPAPVIVMSPVAPPVIVVVPPVAQAPATFGDLGPCPAPYRERPTGALRQPTDQEIKHLAGSPSDSRLVAAWTDFDLYVSRDGGSSWDHVLDGPGQIVDASFDCHGRALVLREKNGLGIRDGVREGWRAIPGIEMKLGEDDEPHYTSTLVGGGRSIAVVGPNEGMDGWVAVTDDGGATWRHVSLGWYEGRTYSAWDGDTLRVVVPWTDCMSEGIRLEVITPAGSTSEELDEWTHDVGLDRGVVYGVSEHCERSVGLDEQPPELCLWRNGRDRRTALRPAPAQSRGDDGIVMQLVDGPVDVVVRNDVVQTITGTRLGRARAWPIDAEVLGTDLAGRLWGTDADGTLIRR
jgi:hypothetical protein